MNEGFAFDGSVIGLHRLLSEILATMPKGVAFVHDSQGNVINRARVKVKTLSDGSRVWDVELEGTWDAK